MKIYAELLGNQENVRIKSLTGNNLGKGSGKTTALTLFLLIESIQRIRERIFCNYKLNFDFDWLAGQDMIELEKKLDNSVIGIDELHEYADARNAASMQNKRVSDFFLQSRHFQCDVFYTSQFKDQVDKRIRRITDIDVISENLYTDLDNDGDDDCFQLVIKDRRLPDSAVRQVRFYAKPVFDLFDSTERINPFVFSKSQEKTWKDKIAKLPLKDAKRIIDKHQRKSPVLLA